MENGCDELTNNGFLTLNQGVLIMTEEDSLPFWRKAVLVPKNVIACQGVRTCRHTAAAHTSNSHTLTQRCPSVHITLNNIFILYKSERY